MVYFALVEVARFSINSGYANQPERSAAFIKIGHSVNVSQRIEYLRGMYRKPIRLLATMPGDLDDEIAMHRRFAHLRLQALPTRTAPEWFYPASELMDFIRSLQDSEKNSETGLDVAMAMP